MRNEISKISVVAILVAIVSLGLSLAVFFRPTSLGGIVHNVQEEFSAGIKVNGTEVISSARSGSFVDVTASGVGTVLRTVSSTVKVGASGTKTGCLEMGSASSSGILYLTANSSSLNVYTTKPAICY